MNSMNWWYAAQTSLPESREVVILQRILGVNENEALGILHRWLAYVNTQTDDGRTGLLPDELDRMMHYSGGNAGALPPGCQGGALVFQALEKCGWAALDESGEVCAVEFDKYNSQSARKRLQNAARVAKSKAKAKDKEKTDGGNAGALPEHYQGGNAGALPEKNTLYKENGSPNGEPKERAKAEPKGAEHPRPANAQEVVDFLATQHLLRLTAAQRVECATAYFNEMEAVQWVDKSGRNVWRWKPHARNYAARWAENVNRPHAGVQQTLKPSRNTGTANEGTNNDWEI